MYGDTIIWGFTRLSRLRGPALTAEARVQLQSILVGFVVDKVALRQVLLLVLRFFCAAIHQCSRFTNPSITDAI